MKTFCNLFYGILFCFSVCGFVSCAFESSKNTSLSQEQEDSALLESDCDYESYPSKTGALTAAHNFIRETFASNAEFEDEGTIIEPTGVPGRFKVLQKFTAEGHPSNWTQFIYRIWVQKFDDGWEFGNLAVESVTGERVFSANGNMKERAE